MKHLVLSPLMPPSRYGGIETIVDNLVTSSVDGTGDSAVVVCADPAARGVETQVQERVTVHRFPAHFFSGIAADHANGLALDVLRGISPSDVDVVQCHDWFLSRAAGALARRLDRPLLAIVHTVKAEERAVLGRPSTTLHEFVEDRQRSLAQNADACLVYSEYMQGLVERHWSLPADRIIRFRCGPTVIPDDRQTPGEDQFEFLFLGRLAPEKGVDLLLEAFAAHREEGFASTLRIIGSGPAFGDLEATTAKHPDAVRIEPFTSSSQVVSAALSRAHCVVAPSRFEPYGLVAAESLCRATPVIVPTRTGMAEIVRHGEWGSVFENGSVAHLAETMREVATNYPAARRRAHRGYDAYADPTAWSRASSTLREAAAACSRATT